MRFEKLILDTFLTYEHLEYDFQNKPILVQGRNLTDPGQTSNGSGKSGIQSGIEFALAASNSRDVRDNELIMFGHDTGRVQLIASCNIRKERIHIDWLLKVKGSNKLTLTKQKFDGDWEEVSFSNVNDGKKWILAWLAISKEDLFNYFIINSNRFKSFFKSSNKEKVELINRFSDATIVDGVESVDTDTLQSEYDNVDRGIVRLNGQVELLETNLATEKARDFEAEMQEQTDEFEGEIEELEEEIEGWEDKIEDLVPKKQELEGKIEDYESEIEELEDEVEELESKISEKKDVIVEIEKSVSEAKATVKAFVTTDWNAERADYEADLKDDKGTLKSLRDEKNKLKEQSSKVAEVLEQVRIQLSGAITCPSCSHEFLLEGDIEAVKERQVKAENIGEQIEGQLQTNKENIASIKEGIEELEESISEINDKQKLENEEYNKLVVAVNKVKQTLTLAESKLGKLEKDSLVASGKIISHKNSIGSVENEIKGLSTHKERYEGKISGIQSQIKGIRRSIEGLKLGSNADSIKKIEKDIKSLKTQSKQESEKLTTLGDEIYKRNQWKTNFKQFKMFLANKSLETIEYHNNRCLADMKSDLRIKLEGYKELANGSIKDEITAKIIRNRERSFGSFSGGEKGRLLFASILANRYMINSTHPYGGLDFLSIDEVFEGIDGSGLKYLMRAIKDFDFPIMIITHVTDEYTSMNVLTVTKENGISTVSN